MPGPRPTRLVLVATGLAAVAAYATGAWLTGMDHGSRGSGILFDGFAPPPPYRWVSPPPQLAPGNETPQPASATVALGPEGSEEAAISTPDLQATMFIASRTFPSRPGQRSVALTILPSAPATPVEVDRYALSGNVYRFAARYEPSGAAIERLEVAARIVLVHPAPPAGEGSEHAILASGDGVAWQVLETTAAPAQHQASADVVDLGFYAVGRRSVGGGGLVSGPLRVAILVLLILAALLAAYLAFRWRGRT